MKKELEEYVEDLEEIVVEVVKAPFKIVGKLFNWITGEE